MTDLEKQTTTSGKLSLKDRLTNDMKQAMRDKNKESLSVIRMLLSEIKYAQAKVNLQTELSDAENQKIVAGYCKKLQKSLGDFPDGTDKDKLKNEIVIVEGYLPTKVSDAEVEALLKDFWQAGGERNLGAAMKHAMEKFEGRVDGRALSDLIKKLLN